MIQPRNDRVLIRRIEEPEQVIGSIIVPEVAREKALKGEVLAVGPGKWEPGEFWNVSYYDIATDSFKRQWEWVPGHRVPNWVHPGQIVYFASKWNDLAADHYENLPIEADPLLHLVQAADIYGIAGPSAYL